MYVSDWLERTSVKWPCLCRVGHKPPCVGILWLVHAADTTVL